MDYAIFQFFNQVVGKNAVLDNTIIFFAHYVPYLLVFFLIGLLFWKQPNMLKKIKNFLMIGLATISAMIVRFIAVPIIRLLWNRLRPFEAHQVAQLLNHSSGGSFPSGHASFFFALSMGIYLFNKKLGRIYLILTTVMVICRVIAGVHYPGDILAGAFLGVSFVWVSGKYFKTKMEVKFQQIKNFRFF